MTLGPTPRALQRLGLAPVDLAMAAGKIARVRREHPEVTLAIWHRLPELVRSPLAVLPSAKRDGSFVMVLIVLDANGDPVLVPIAPGQEGAPNVVLSIYGKEAGFAWVQRELAHAAADNLPHLVNHGFAAALPQPGSASAIPSSPGPIPADGTAKPIKQILRLPPTINEEPGDA